MKRKIRFLLAPLFAALFFASSFSVSAQCFPGGIGFTSQADINNFIVEFPYCTHISGNVSISGSNITNLNGLANVTSIGGYLYIGGNPQLTNLNGLSSLTSIGGYLSIYNNFSLTSLNGFSSLTNIGGAWLSIGQNSSLTSINGFPALTSIGGHLTIWENPLLTGINGFSSLQSIGEWLGISNNSSLAGIDGFPALTNIGGYLSIWENSALLSIDGFPSLTSIGGEWFGINNNPSLASIDGFSALTSIEGYFTIWENSALLSIDGFPSLTSIGEWFAIHNNSSLVSIDGFPALTSIGGDLDIYNNSSLTSIDGFPELTTVGQSFAIWNNPLLTSINGFLSLQSVETFLHIHSNASLAGIDGFPVLTTVGQSFSIRNDSSLTSIDGFSALTSIGRNLIIRDNSSLTNVDGLSALTTIADTLQIYGNSSLTSIDGLSALTSVGDFFQISVNPQLTNVDGLSALTTIGGVLFLYYTSFTNLDGLSALTNVGALTFQYNFSLTNVDGLSALTSIGGNLGVYDNPLLTNVDGLTNVTSIGTNLMIQNNPLLTDISGLENIDPATIAGTLGLRILNNGNLSLCNLSNFCTYLSYDPIEKPRAISGNLDSCFNETLVLLACGFTIWYLDADNDGWYVSTQIAENNPGAGWTSILPPGGSGDCDDNNPAINPVATEICSNGIDDNCDGIAAGEDNPYFENEYEEIVIDGCYYGIPFWEPTLVNGCPGDELIYEEYSWWENECTFGVVREWRLESDPSVVAWQYITIVDYTAPVFISLPTVVTETLAPGETTVNVFYNVTGYDDCSWDAYLEYSIPPGSAFEEGETTVYVTLSDACGNSTYDSFMVVVNPVPSVYWYLDADGDGHYTAILFTANNPGIGWTVIPGIDGDCDDNDNSVWQTTALFIDDDGDGYTLGSEVVCYGVSIPDGYTLLSLGNDCNDNNINVHPGAIEICGNGVDDNCNDSTDEDCDCIVNIPDPNFKTALLGNPTINTNNDSQIQCSEASAYTGAINLAGLGVIDLTGLETFVNLTELDCSINPFLNDLNVSANTALRLLRCEACNLTGINLTANIALEELYLNTNSIGSLNLTSNTALKNLDCGWNDISNLNVSANTALETLYFWENNVSNINLAANTQLINLSCQNNSLSSLNLSSNTALQTLVCYGNNLSSLNLSGNPALVNIECYNNNLNSLNIQNGSNNILFSFYATDNPSLACVQVDNVGYMNSNWPFSIPSGALYSLNCSSFPPPTNNNPAPNNPTVTSVNYVYPNCFQIQGTTLGATPSPNTGERDVWYQLVAMTNGISIRVNSSVIDAKIFLFRSDDLNTIVDEEDLLDGTGTEVLNFGGLIPGQSYRIAIAAVGSNDGAFSLCIQQLRKPTCGSAPSNGYGLCSTFKPTSIGAASTTAIFDDGTPTSITSSGSIPLSAPSLELLYGTNYEISLTANYELNDGNGNIEYITIANPNACSITTTTQPSIEVKPNQRCPAVLYRASYLQGTSASGGTICGAVGYNVEFTQTSSCSDYTGNPLSTFTRNINSPSAGIALNTAFSDYPTSGNPNVGYWIVRWRPTFAGGVHGNWGNPRIIAVNGTSNASTMQQNDSNSSSNLQSNDSNIDANIYPNPNNGDMVNLNMTGITSSDVFVRIVDGMGRVVYTNRYTVEGSLNTIITFSKPLASGIYLVEFTTGDEVITQRMMVAK